MKGNRKNILLVIILIGIVSVSNFVRMKVKTHQVVLNARSSISDDYEQVALTFLTATNGLVPQLTSGRQTGDPSSFIDKTNK